MDEGKTFGSPRLPADSPDELQGHPAAQITWTRLVTSNPALRDLDHDLVVEFCRGVERRLGFIEDRKLIDPKGVEYQDLSEIIERETEYLRGLYRDMYPADPGAMPDFYLDA